MLWCGAFRRQGRASRSRSPGKSLGRFHPSSVSWINTSEDLLPCAAVTGHLCCHAQRHETMGQNMSPPSSHSVRQQAIKISNELCQQQQHACKTPVPRVNTLGALVNMDPNRISKLLFLHPLLSDRSVKVLDVCQIFSLHYLR